MKTWAAEGRASGAVWLLHIHQDSFKEMLSVIPSMIERIVFLQQAWQALIENALDSMLEAELWVCQPS
jgi:hypothetical protein